MHQQNRNPQRVSSSSPATSPQTNPARTNNPRQAVVAAVAGHVSRLRSGSGAMMQDGSSAEAEEATLVGDTGPTRESIKKLDQIVQNFHCKAAALILQARMNVTSVGGRSAPNRKTNKWFQIEIEDIEDFRDELRIWKTCGSFENRPPPMLLETYLDASRLSSSQSLLVLDEHGKGWDALDALNSSDSFSDGSSPRRQQKRNTEIILERWRVELKCTPADDLEEFGPGLPTIYKKCIVFFRSLVAATKILPCWKFVQPALARGTHPALEVKCRFRLADDEYSGYDPLRLPLFDGRDVTTEYMFADLEVPVGRIYTSVTYRNDCSFRVEDAESPMSSRFLGVDEQFFKPSMPLTTRREVTRDDSFGEMASLPAHQRDRGVSEPQQTYGSLSTFHGAGALGTSPLTALKAMRPVGSDTSSPPGSTPASVEPDPRHSLPTRTQSMTARPLLRNAEGHGRRPSVSFQPFKAGSLSGSPRVPEMDVPPSPQSLSRPSGLSGISQARNRSSLTAGMAASLRGNPVVPTAAELSPVVGSPRPSGSRYSSSFKHKRAISSFGGQNKAADDDQVSSGKQSLSSSTQQPGSGLLAEGGGGASSGSLQADDDNISEFLKVIDSRKTLQSFEPKQKGESSAARRTAMQLSKFQLMRESNNALTESMTSSMQMHRSSSSSSRQLTNVPSMVNPASMSTSSSPGKPVSPHTPHTPAIPSRLSENSIIDYRAPGQTTLRQSRNASRVDEDEDDDHAVRQEGGTRAIEIPLSPRLLHTTRRSSSVAQQQGRAALLADDEQRSISLDGGADAEAPTLSRLLDLQPRSSTNVPAGLRAPADIRPASSGSGSFANNQPPSYGGGRLRYQPRGRGGSTPPPNTSTRRFSSGGTRYGVCGRAGDEGDEEPLVFAMSELERDSRRSLEEGRGGGSVGSGSGSAERFEMRGTSRRGW